MPINPYQSPQELNEREPHRPTELNLSRVGKYFLGGALVGLIFAVGAPFGLIDPVPSGLQWVLIAMACCGTGGLSAAACSLVVGD